MIAGTIGYDERYCVEQLSIAADYALAPAAWPPLPGTSPLDSRDHRHRVSALHDIGLGGACLCIGDGDLDLGRHIVIRIALDQIPGTARKETATFLARVLWRLETPKCRKVGLQFLAVPRGFAALIERISVLADPCEPKS